MWVHLIIFGLVFGTVIVWKAGWLRLDGIADRESIRLFLMVAVCGNLLGMTLTFTSGRAEIYPEGYRLEKNPDAAYTENLEVTVDGGEPEDFAVQIPEKETEEAQDEPETKTTESEEEQRQRELREVIEKYNLQKQDPDYYYLPDKWDGKSLQWQKNGDNTGTLLASLALFAAFVLLLKKAREQQEELAKRAEQLLMDYPSLIMKFTLLVQAGMTVRRAFQKISTDYMRSRHGTERFAYEAMITACHEMDSGVAEVEAYRRFGERCGQMKYKTFSTILVQNLQKGGHRMADLLEKEALEAWDERKRKARVLGETAATKLLVPMIMMLAVVMAIIMIPAFLSFYG
ncbi:type II secretion system F family protein [Blautia sp. MSJ-19]|uniref:type II secretion system F family protein n=1 Tax=Blautia sp. MSJ-19 TaxID=2841517 RepID=UPI001C0ECC7C|nr:type II secretion system F family protein [Blautia sp. MSJ-19]MBU5482443.1 type II secretion system F family protein [Blautia sp. MSJ-19]